MPKVRCPLCHEETDDLTSVRFHLNKEHFMTFADNDDMKRRLSNVGVDIEIKTDAIQLNG